MINFTNVTGSHIQSGNWEIIPLENSPEAVTDFGMTTNTLTGDIIMTGGQQASTGKDQNKQHTRGIAEWEPLTSAQSIPTIYSHVMTFDPVTNELILLSGKTSSDVWNQDMYIFDFDNQTWGSSMSPFQPSIRDEAVMTYDNQSKLHLFYGGYYEPTSTVFQDLWAFNSTDRSWSLLSETNLPGQLYSANMQYISSIDATLLFGGREIATSSDKTFLYYHSNSTWVQITSIQTPGARSDAAIAYDYVNDKVIMNGGTTDGSTAAYSDTWTFDPQTLQWQVVVTNSVESKYGHSMTYSEKFGGVISFGGLTEFGYKSDTYEFTWNLNEVTVTETKTITETTTETSNHPTETTTHTVFEDNINNTENLTLSTSYLGFIAPLVLVTIATIYQRRQG